MTRSDIVNIVESTRKGFHIGTRLILPFKCNVIKLIADGHIFTEFVGSNDVKISQEKQNTSIYFREVGRLSQFEGSYKSVKMVIASENDDLSNPKTHIKIICHILDDREVELELPTEDDLFIS